jgi:hypothetical protein
MKPRSLVVLFSLLTLGLRAQAPIPVSLVGLLQEMPPPPTNLMAARQLMDPGDPTKKGVQLQAYEAKLQKTQTDIISPPATQSLQQKYADPAFQQKMASMSDAEKVAMAMQMQAEMQSSMSAGASRPHPPTAEMKTAIAGFQQFNLAEAQAGGVKARTAMAEATKVNDERAKEKAAHDKIDADAQAAFDKMSFKDGVDSPAAFAVQRKLQAAAWQSHFDLINAHLAADRKVWDDAKAAALPALTKLDADLKAIKYADGESATNRQMMSSYQGAGVRRLLTLLELAESDLAYAGDWSSRYENWQKSGQ